MTIILNFKEEKKNVVFAENFLDEIKWKINL